MTDKDKKSIVKLVSNGKNTYKDLYTTFPHINNWQVLGFYERISPDDVIKIDRKQPYNEAITYKPVDDDTFHLTNAGLDILDKMNMEELILQKQDESIKWAKYAVVVGTISAVATIISILIAA